jgi:2-octaprenyl-6-methoxyphenol hydroxylase
MKRYDILIVGGGIVGASLARALSGQGLAMAMVEAVEFETRAVPGYDDRAIALAQGTQRIFDGMQLWGSMQDEATPIHRIHVSDRGHAGITRMDREEEGLAALGYVVPARVIGRVLGEYVRQTGEVDLYCPATLKELSIGADSVQATLLENGREQAVASRLVVAADGAGSVVRERLGIPVTDYDYAQTAVITNVTPQLPHRNTAFERFTDTGPLAFLPMTEQRCAVVWTVPAGAVEEVMGFSDAAFLARLQERFGFRLGRLERMGQRQAWPLHLIKAREYVRARIALVGNAAHTLHPIAGQGFNLGVREIAALAEVVVDAIRRGGDPGDPVVLNRYAEWRHSDQQRVTAFTDGLARLFTLPLPALGAARGAGMLALDLIPPAKRLLTRLTMGRGGRISRLGCGLPL